MTRPRLILKDEVVMGTRKTSEGRFFLRSDAAMDWLFLYCLARAARISGVQLHEFQVLSNHYHVVFTDVNGERSTFFHELNQFVARGGNRLRGRKENFFQPGSFNAVTLVDGDAIEDECLYTLCNPVKHGLVSSPAEWKGGSSWSMNYGESKPIERPPGFFSKDMEQTEHLVLVRPPALFPQLDDDAARTELRKRADARAASLVKDFKEAGGTFLGMKRVRKQPPESSPRTRPPRKGIRPTVAGKNKWPRIEALLRYKAFLVDHRDARKRYEKGEHDVVFPRGTYLMVKRYSVAVSKT